MSNNRFQISRPVWKIMMLLAFFMIFTDNGSAALDHERGGEQIVSGHTIFSWARVDGDEVVEAGVTIPFALINTPPAQRGSGPAGAIAVVNFSQNVRDTTFLNHFELNWEKDGHEPPVFATPHFDFHFYNTPVTDVMKIALPDPTPPRADLIPVGYVYPGAENTVPQMGVHAVRPADMQKPFSDVLIFGYYGGKMTFLEPMVTREALLKRQLIAYAIPTPAAMGKVTRFPTRFAVEYDADAKACHLKFSDFVQTVP